MEIIKADTQSDANAYWRSKTMQERLEALELIRQVCNPGYEPDTSRMEKVLEVVKGP